MRLAAMQPYFFPYIGYFSLMQQADCWVIFDTAQYIRHGWVNRNRVLHPEQGWQYITVPLEKHSHRTPINGIRIAAGYNWKERILRQLAHCRVQAPYFRQTVEFAVRCWHCPGNSLADLNCETLRMTAEHLGITTPLVRFSETGIRLPEYNSPQELAVHLCRLFGADEYINSPGGTALYDAEFFARNGIKLMFQKEADLPDLTGRFHREERLSVLDTLLWCTPEEISAALKLIGRTGA